MLNGLTIRGSLVGTRQDLEEALDFYARGKINPTVKEVKLGDANEIIQGLVDGAIDGRRVIRY